MGKGREGKEGGDSGFSGSCARKKPDWSRTIPACEDESGPASKCLRCGAGLHLEAGPLENGYPAAQGPRKQALAFQKSRSRLSFPR